MYELKLSSSSERISRYPEKIRKLVCYNIALTGAKLEPVGGKTLMAIRAFAAFDDI
jgi:hypothetical protein